MQIPFLERQPHRRGAVGEDPRRRGAIHEESPVDGGEAVVHCVRGRHRGETEVEAVRAAIREEPVTESDGRLRLPPSRYLLNEKELWAIPDRDSFSQLLQRGELPYERKDGPEAFARGWRRDGRREL